MQGNNPSVADFIFSFLTMARAVYTLPHLIVLQCSSIKWWQSMFPPLKLKQVFVTALTNRMWWKWACRIRDSMASTRFCLCLHLPLGLSCHVVRKFELRGDTTQKNSDWQAQLRFQLAAISTTRQTFRSQLPTELSGMVEIFYVCANTVTYALMRLLSSGNVANVHEEVDFKLFRFS